MAVLAVALVCCIAKLLYHSFTLKFGREDVLVLQMCMSDNVKKYILISKLYACWVSWLKKRKYAVAFSSAIHTQHTTERYSDHGTLKTKS
jgi:hypothetical protein